MWCILNRQLSLTLIDAAFLLLQKMLSAPALAQRQQSAEG